MAKKTKDVALVTNPHFDTVLVEQSDNRLAEVEIAKRTGNAFVSVGTAGSAIVPQDVADQIAYEKSLQNTTIGPSGRPIAAHRKDYLEALSDDEESFTERTNEEKAQEHFNYSSRLAKAQRKQELSDLKDLREGRDIAAEILARQARLADDYTTAQNAWNESRRELLNNAPTVNQVIAELVEKIDVVELAGKSLEERMADYAAVITVPDALEAPAQEALVVKDHIISTEESFSSFAEGGNLTPVEQEAQVEEVEKEEPVLPQPTARSAKGPRQDAGTLEPNSPKE